MYSNPQSFVQSKISHIHSSHSSIGNDDDDDDGCDIILQFPFPQRIAIGRVIYLRTQKH